MNATQALKLLKENGYKHTKQRIRLLELLDKQEQYLSVKHLWGDFQVDFPGASYDTVYRNLYTLSELGILETTTLDGEKHFRFHCETDGHHHHFICTTCGKTNAIDICPMDAVTDQLPEHQIEHHTFEVYGKCPSCM